MPAAYTQHLHTCLVILLVMITGFHTKSFIFDPRPSYPLLSVVKRYWKEDSPHIDDPDALTLIFLHGGSFHKEQWEPTIDDLQAILYQKSGSSNVRIREIWTMDALNHGDSAVLNESALKMGYEHIFAWEEFARNIHLFVSGLGTGVDYDFTGHNLVGIGHSMGAVSLALSLGYYPKIKFVSVILCEIIIMPESFCLMVRDTLVSGAERRKAVWPSKDEAYNLLKSKGACMFWDDRVLRTYVESGMRSLPTSDYPDVTDGVTLKCTRIQEAACYRDGVGSRRVYHNLENIVKQVPTHLIFGEIDDYLPGSVKEDIVERAGGIDNLASFARVPGAGHLVVQMNPSRTAEKIYDALVITSNRNREFKRAKL